MLYVKPVLSREQVAEHMGVTRKTMSNMMSAESVLNRPRFRAELPSGCIGFYNQQHPHQALKMLTPNPVLEIFKLAS
jgi:hypothetical protein